MAFKERWSSFLGAGVTVVFVLATISVVCIVLVGGWGVNTATQVPGKSVERVFRPNDLAVYDAAAVYASYQANKGKADADMTNKLFAVKGIIRNIGKDILDSPYIALDAGTNDKFVVQCMFKESDRNQLAQLSCDTMVLIAGKCAGQMGDVVITECWFYSPGMFAEPEHARTRAEYEESKKRFEQAFQVDVRDTEANVIVEQQQEADTADQARTRTWTSADRKFTVEARFIKSNPITVTLEKLDGTVIQVPREKLCEDDLEFIK